MSGVASRLALPMLVVLGACGDGETTRGAPARPKAQPVAETFVREPKGTTPMAERVAVLGVLNKRNGRSVDLEMTPGQVRRAGAAVVRLRACERTQNWEAEQMTGAFVQVDIADSRQRLRRVFSGWLFKETPSLNVVEHPVYDVWVKECRMSRPDETPVEEEGADVPSNASVSSADQSEDTDSASDSNAE